MKKRKQLAVTCATVLAILVTLSMARGWIRGTFIPAYVRHFYKNGVDREFDRQFSLINKELGGLGFTPRQSDQYLDKCSGDSYELFSQTVTCTKSHTTGRTSFNTEFVDYWHRKSSDFERNLLAHGWHKEWNAAQPIEKIYDNPNNDQSVGVVYAKMMGKTGCVISIMYNANYGNETYVNRSCARQVKFFGGR